MPPASLTRSGSEVAPSDLDSFISIDVETSGPIPGRYSLLAIGACLVADPSRTFYAELQPTSLEADPEAMAVHGLSLQKLQQDGLPPAKAIEAFDAWIRSLCPPPARPVFVSYNASFDWAFINDAFIHALGRNPFGHSALDIRAVYMGRSGRPWLDITFAEVSRRYLQSRQLSHQALEDAQAQAEIFRGLMHEPALRLP
jgi:DNA polymerase III epsilon subunit-like protein